MSWNTSLKRFMSAKLSELTDSTSVHIDLLGTVVSILSNKHQDSQVIDWLIMNSFIWMVNLAFLHCSDLDLNLYLKYCPLAQERLNFKGWRSCPGNQDHCAMCMRTRRGTNRIERKNIPTVFHGSFTHLLLILWQWKEKSLFNARPRP